MFLAMIAENRDAGSDMEVVALVGVPSGERRGIYTHCRGENLIPLACLRSVWKVLRVSSALRMLFRAASALMLEDWAA